MNNMVLKVLAGSRAYGLETPESDWDFHGVYVTPTSELLALGAKPKPSVWKEGDEDFQSWEFGHFLNLAVHCNPTMLETLAAPVVVVEEPTLIIEYGHRPPELPLGVLTVGEKLRSMLPRVLARERVYEAFRGYAHNQRAKLFSKRDFTPTAQPTARTWKFAVQYIRALAQGERLLRTGELVVDLNDKGYGLLRAYLLDLKLGHYSMGDAVDRAEAMERKLETAYLDSEMQEEPDLGAVNEFLLNVRKASW